MFPPVGKLPGLDRGGKAQRRALQERMLGSGGEFGSGHVESKVVGASRTVLGQRLGSLASLCLHLEPVPWVHTPYLEKKQFDSLAGRLVGRSHL